MTMAAKPCVFLDRDGVIVVPEFRAGRSYAPTTLHHFSYFATAFEALSRLNAAGYLLIVITNQPDVGNGITPQTVVEAMHEKMYKDLPIHHIEVCYHTREDRCDCRKPQPGMLLNAIKKFNIDLNCSFLVGDRSSDIEVGKKMNLKTIFIDYQYQESLVTQPDYVCKDLLEGCEIILNNWVGSKL